MIFLIFRSLQSVESDLLKSASKLNEIVLDNTAWEEETKLKLKNGKNAVKLIAQKYEKTLKSTSEMIEKLSGTNDLLANKNSNNRKELSDVLKITSDKLEIADKSGKSAEKLLRQAKSQGDKEAAKYLKFVPLSASLTSTSNSAGNSNSPGTASIPALSKATKTK